MFILEIKELSFKILTQEITPNGFRRWLIMFRDNQQGVVLDEETDQILMNESAYSFPVCECFFNVAKRFETVALFMDYINSLGLEKT